MIYETLQILKEQLESYHEDVGQTKNIVPDHEALWKPGFEEDKSSDRELCFVFIFWDTNLRKFNLNNLQVQQFTKKVIRIGSIDSCKFFIQNIYQKW